MLGVKLRDFPLKPGHAYFIDVPENMNMSMFGELPGPVTYELKRRYIPELQTYYGYNYIILPLNTSLKWASELCADIGLNNIRRIRVWNSELQNPELIVYCPPRIGEDKQIKAGVSYELDMKNETVWVQK